jgi:hypothetical protein
MGSISANGTVVAQLNVRKKTARAKAKEKQPTETGSCFMTSTGGESW